MEDGHKMGAIFFDLTKAFDSEPHRQLISKLRAIGLDDYLVSWIMNHLTNRSQSVVLHGETSDLLPVTSSGISTWSPAVLALLCTVKAWVWSDGHIRGHRGYMEQAMNFTFEI